MSTLNADFSLADMLKGYVECALWSSTDDNERPLDDNYGPDDLASECLEEMRRDCRDFVDTCTEQGIDLTKVDGRPADYIGHDFWLTRNRHGAGFWDRGLGELGDRLSDIAHAAGSADLYVGDDGKVYHG